MAIARYSIGMSELQSLLDEDQAAALLHVSIKTLQGWRQRKTGPRYFKLSNRVRYSPDDLRVYLAQCAVEPARGGEGP
jgi:Helix-turn-helix domain